MKESRRPRGDSAAAASESAATTSDSEVTASDSPATTSAPAVTLGGAFGPHPAAAAGSRLREIREDSGDGFPADEVIPVEEGSAEDRRWPALYIFDLLAAGPCAIERFPSRSRYDSQIAVTG